MGLEWNGSVTFVCADAREAGGVNTSIRHLVRPLLAAGASQVDIVTPATTGRWERLSADEFVDLVPVVGVTGGTSRLAAGARRVGAAVVPDRCWAAMARRAGGHPKLDVLVPDVDGGTALIITHPRLALDLCADLRRQSSCLWIGQYHDSVAAAVSNGHLRELRRAYAGFDACVVLTEDDRRALERRWRGGPPIVALPNAVDSAPSSPYAAGSTRYLAVGRLAPQKDFAALLRVWALAGLSERRLVIVGEGPERPRLECLIRRLALEGSAELVGYHEDPGSLLADARGILLTSKHEGLPMALLEAAAAGVPSIAFDCSPGVRHVIGANRSGVLVPAGDVNAMVLELRRFDADAERREQLSTGARSVAANHATAVVAQRWVSLLSNRPIPTTIGA